MIKFLYCDECYIENYGDLEAEQLVLSFECEEHRDGARRQLALDMFAARHEGI